MSIDTCSICLEEFNPSLNKDYQKQTCNHTFHTQCITQWFLVNNSCPICRTIINKSNLTPSDDVEANYVQWNISSIADMSHMFDDLLARITRNDNILDNISASMTRNADMSHMFDDLLARITRNDNMLDNISASMTRNADILNNISASITRNTNRIASISADIDSISATVHSIYDDDDISVYDDID